MSYFSYNRSRLSILINISTTITVNYGRLGNSMARTPKRDGHNVDRAGRLDKDARNC